MDSLKVYISYSSKDAALAALISGRLKALHYEVSLDVESLSAGQNWRQELESSLLSADVFISLLTSNSLGSQQVIMELGAARSFSQSTKRMLVIPIVFDDIPIPNIISDLYVIRAEFEELESVIQEIQRAISHFIGSRAADEKQEAEVKERIEQNSATFIQEAMDSLEKQEKRDRRVGNAWYIVGYIALISGIAYAFYSTSRFSEITELEWIRFAYLVLKSVLVVGLLVATTKYAFTLGKSFMTEALKSADRVHAISFGKFYLRAFGEKVTWNELKEVFQHWNIDRNSSFSAIQTNDFDPKFLEAVVEIAKAASSKIEIKN